MDGGSENANKYIMCICELLVSMNVTKKIVITRLPVGHTHEDIDSKFAKIWVGLRNKSVVSPQVSIFIVSYFLYVYIYKMLLHTTGVWSRTVSCIREVKDAVRTG